MASEFVCPECGAESSVRVGHKTSRNTQLICDVDECSWETYVFNPQTRTEKISFDALGMWSRIGDGEE